MGANDRGWRRMPARNVRLGAAAISIATQQSRSDRVPPSMQGARKRPWRRSLAFSATVVTLLAMTAGPDAAMANGAHITEFRLPMVPSHVGDLVAGPDGDMWFTAMYVHDFVPPSEGKLVREIDRISADGRIGAVVSPRAASALTPGPENSVWLVDAGNIDKLTADGRVTEFSLQTHFPTRDTFPTAIAEGPDGNIWFTGLHYLGNAGGPPESVEVIGRMTPTGQASEFPLAGKELGLTALAAGPDGNVWFTESNANKIGRVTPSGQITEFAIPTDEARPSGIVTGPDGNVWFTEQRLNSPAAIGRIDPSGQIAEFPLSGDAAYPEQIVAGVDGRLWFTNGVGAVGMIAPNGHSTRIALPRRSQVRAIAAGSEGDIWYAADGDPPCEGGGGTCMMQIPKEPGVIGRIEPAPLSAEIAGYRATLRGRWARLKLACAGGNADELCRGTLRLTVKARGRRGRRAARTLLLAQRRYALATDTSRVFGLRLRPRGLPSRHHARLGAQATVTTAGGQTSSRRVVLVGSTPSRRHSHRR